MTTAHHGQRGDPDRRLARPYHQRGWIWATGTLRNGHYIPARNNARFDDPGMSRSPARAASSRPLNPAELPVTLTETPQTPCPRRPSGGGPGAARRSQLLLGRGSLQRYGRQVRQRYRQTHRDTATFVVAVTEPEIDAASLTPCACIVARADRQWTVLGVKCCEPARGVSAHSSRAELGVPTRSPLAAAANGYL